MMTLQYSEVPRTRSQRFNVSTLENVPVAHGNRTVYCTYVVFDHDHQVCIEVYVDMALSTTAREKISASWP